MNCGKLNLVEFTELPFEVICIPNNIHLHSLSFCLATEGEKA